MLANISHTSMPYCASVTNMSRHHVNIVSHTMRDTFRAIKNNIVIILPPPPVGIVAAAIFGLHIWQNFCAFCIDSTSCFTGISYMTHHVV